MVSSEFYKGFYFSIESLFFTFSLIAAFFGIAKFALNFFGIGFGKGYGTSLLEDQNFYALSLLIGILILLVRKSNNKRDDWFFILFLTALTLSGSRRGLLVFVFIILIVLIINTFLFKFSIKSINRKLLIVFFSFVFGYFGLVLTYKISNSGKLNLSFIKYNIERISGRYATILGLNELIINRNPIYDLNKPETWSAKASDKIVTINNLGIPYKEGIEKAIMVDSVSPTYFHNDWSFYNSKIPNYIIGEGKYIRASIYCYCSYNNNSDIIALETNQLRYEDRHVFKTNSINGKWQKLELEFFEDTTINTSINYVVYKKNVKDFKSLNGFVLFSNPIIERFNPNGLNPGKDWGIGYQTKIVEIEDFNGSRKNANCLLLNGQTPLKVKNYNGIILLDKLATTSKTKSYYSSVDCFVSTDFSGDSISLELCGNKCSKTNYNLNKRGVWQTLEVYSNSQEIQNSSLKIFSKDNLITGEVLFYNPKFYIPTNLHLYLLGNSSREQRKFDVIQNKVVGARLQRYEFALEYFSNLSIRNQLFGSGFKYLTLYGVKFYQDETRLDYPHNPIISAFLYSGIIGGIFYLTFLLVVFWYYIKYLKYHSTLFLIYVLTLFFTILSGNSHFSVPLFAFLSLIPFLTKFNLKNKSIEKSNEY